jgi:hypothetical protein
MAILKRNAWTYHNILDLNFLSVEELAYVIKATYGEREDRSQETPKLAPEGANQGQGDPED